MKALILVDIQKDFLPGGALAVPDGDAVIDVANRLMPHYDMVVATQDWHPAAHQSFANQHAGQVIGDSIELNGLPQVLWPDHCVQGTDGASLSPQLYQSLIHEVVQKGTDPQIDSYSGFFDNGHRKATGLSQLLRSRDIEEVHVLGLATDYCVKFTALNAVKEGFDTHVILPGCCGVDLMEGDSDKAINEMEQMGVKRVNVLDKSTEPIGFYSTKDAFGCFSNFPRYDFELDGKQWRTSEHYFQAQKFEDEAYREKIRLTPSPMIVARLGRSRSVPIRDDWETAKDDVMRRAVHAKFMAHQELQEVLESTGDRLLIEKTSKDYYWGCGTKGTGKNMLGLILMEVRAQLRALQCAEQGVVPAAARKG